jgi:hypothetical protein
MTRLRLAPTILLAGCAGASSAIVTPPAPTTPGELADLHATVRVEALQDRRFNHGTYWEAVGPFLNGAVSAGVAGHSAEGRVIRHVVYGSGATKVLLWSQMHGNESTASMALADVVRFFHEQPDHPLARRIAAGATIHMIPLLNPDGAERFQRRNAQGMDVNRDARRLQTPEGRLLKRVNDELRPDFGFNLHDQSAAVRVGSSDRGAAIAPLVPDHIARYDDTFNPRAFGDLVGAWGASTVLIESGAWPDDPQKQHLRKANFVGILSALDAIATGRYAQYGTELYEGLEYNGRRVPDLLIAGGTIAVPGLPVLEADILVNYERPLLQEEGVIADIGDMGGSEAQDTLDATGLFIIPREEALDAMGGLNTGAQAHFTIAEDPQGRRVRIRFLGGPPKRTP